MKYTRLSDRLLVALLGRARELAMPHPHICQKWRGGHVGDGPDVGNLAGARKLELTENEQFSISKLADPVSQKCP